MYALLYAHPLHRELLEKIKDFEDKEFSGSSRDGDFKPALRLQPLNESGSSALLNMVRTSYFHRNIV